MRDEEELRKMRDRALSEVAQTSGGDEYLDGVVATLDWVINDADNEEPL